MILILLSLAGGTLVSEDLACVSAGILVQRGTVDPLSAVLACATGIFLGDVALWAAGRAFGHAALRWPLVGRHLQRRGARELANWLNRHPGRAILVSRFLPGARLPLYVLAGVLRLSVGRFSFWAAVAALVWTPAPVLTTARLGDLVVTSALLPARFAWAAPVGAALVALAIVRTVSGGRETVTPSAPTA